MSNAQHDPASLSTPLAGPVAAAHPGLPWHRSTYSGGANNCVEAAGRGQFVRIRDSKSVPGPMLAVAADAWSEFLGRVSVDGSTG